MNQNLIVNVDEKLSLRFRSMSLLCACMVVLIHSTVHPQIGSCQWWIAFIFGSLGVCRIAVPFFFVASGFFLAGHLGERGWYSYALKSRVKSLLIPYYLWTVVTILICVIIRLGIRLTGYNYEGGCFTLPSFTFGWVTAALGVSPFADVGAPIWYLRTLFLFVLISPVSFGLTVGRRGIILLLVFLAATILYDAVCFAYEWKCWGLTCFFSLKGAFFFTLGMMLRRAGIPVFGRKVRNLMALVAVGLILLKGYFLTAGLGIFVAFVEPAMIVAVMCTIWAFLGDRTLPRILTSMAFPIYLMHAYFIWFVSAGFALFGLSVYGESSLLAMVIKFAVALGGAMLSTYILRRTFPKAAGILFGGR